ncbi:oligopeptide ABC transporter substrate-binding protein [Salmonella enterica subsp. enterica]|uniref:Oligopeptide ABC transporter substrate-binding protein n=1 Tax=Salmonella enterica I TaxID=59201 RepID=A0A3S4IKA2_SALET|nr:oligopeptide ABC transporter substrate-binding protein [Salmonella enterica subsp. enterica]
MRTALKLALDRDIIVNKVKNQGDLPAYSYTPPYTDGAKLVEPEWFKWSQQKRNEEAKKLLAEAGFTADKPLTFDLLYNTSDLHKKTGHCRGVYLEEKSGRQCESGESGMENLPGYPSSGHL